MVERLKPNNGPEMLAVMGYKSTSSSTETQKLNYSLSPCGIEKLEKASGRKGCSRLKAEGTRDDRIGA
jgi:hypothetical protein